MQLEIFRPWNYERSPLSLDNLQAQSGKKFQYAPSGKASIYHLVRALKIRRKILLPAYLCKSVLRPLRQLEIQPEFYDVDTADLNGSIESLANAIKRTGAEAVLLASLYGHAANLVEIERYCAERGLILIDDGAQSFGASLESRRVSTFGDGGFFSFSPGKATAGHCGSFFWSKSEYSFERKQRKFSHALRYLDFYVNRLRVYDWRKLSLGKLALRYSVRALDKCGLDYDGDLSRFEEPILGGILQALPLHQLRRNEIIEKFWNEWNERSTSGLLTPVRSARGIPSPHKIVFKVPTEEFRAKLVSGLTARGIYAASGYTLLGSDEKLFPNAADAAKRVVELPVEPDAAKMQYLFETLFQLVER